MSASVSGTAACAPRRPIVGARRRSGAIPPRGDMRRAPFRLLIRTSAIAGSCSTPRSERDRRYQRSYGATRVDDHVPIVAARAGGAATASTARASRRRERARGVAPRSVRQRSTRGNDSSSSRVVTFAILYVTSSVPNLTVLWKQPAQRELIRSYSIRCTSSNEIIPKGGAFPAMVLVVKRYGVSGSRDAVIRV